MLPENLHLSERDLILAADGELPTRRRAEVAAHLETCWFCGRAAGVASSAHG